MSEVFYLKSAKQIQKNSAAKEQLLLPIDTKDFSGNLTFVFEENITPENIQKIISAEGVRTVADVRRVPFFAGAAHRHKKINEVLSKLEIPVFHIGTAFFSMIDQSLPPTTKCAQLIKQIENIKGVKAEISERLNVGACLIVVDHEVETLMATKVIVDVIQATFANTHVKINDAWASIQRETSR